MSNFVYNIFSVLKYSLLIALFFSFSQLVQAQPEINSLSDHYKELKKEAENYKEYKVVKKAELDKFWAAVNDSIGSYQAAVKSLKNEREDLKKELQLKKQRNEEVEVELNKQGYEIEHISFLGIDMTKTSFKVLITLIIVFLILLVVLMWFRFSSSNKITKEVKGSYLELEEEYEAFRKQSREKEIELKRELQTAINKLDDLKSNS